jgi:hypothetical protein
MVIDVYHSGRGKIPRAPFVFVRAGAARLPDHPLGNRITWTYWQQAPLKQIAVAPAVAEAAITENGYFVQ